MKKEIRKIIALGFLRFVSVLFDLIVLSVKGVCVYAFINIAILKKLFL